MTPERFACVKKLFLEAVTLEQSERQAFLERACGTDTDLMAEVEALLRHDHSQTLIGSQDEAAIADYKRQPRIKSSISNTFRALGVLTKHLDARGHVAIGALVACILVVLIGYLSNQHIRSFQKTLRAEALTEILAGKVGGLKMWIEHEQEKIESWVRSEELRRLINELVQLAGQSNEVGDDVKNSPLQEAIAHEIATLQADTDHFTIWDRRHITIADTFTGGDSIGRSTTPWGAAVLARVFDGETQMLTYDQNHTVTNFEPSTAVDPHVGTVTPVRNDDGEIIAAMLIHDHDGRIQATRIFRMVGLGESGETYAFNKEGVMLTESRFDDQLHQMGLLPDQPDATSSRVVELRDPGGDMTKGYRPNQPRSTWPLTKMAQHATAGIDGVDVEGYRDYRGVEVDGAWRWLEEYQVGVATEVDKHEMEPGLSVLIFESWAVAGLISVCLGVVVFSYLSIRRLRRQIKENRKLGHYTLEEKIGEGGMGKVFKARHDMLKRPTAIKFLKQDILDKDSIARFQREAQLASQLTHPNTIEVFDYGVTPEGIFYYVMEYIDGLSLDQLVGQYGPLPPARVAYILKQVCYSLREAHAMEMVHRDLKPQNIMLCHRGGEADVVKVLDFGLVRMVEPTESQKITVFALVAGTPLYIAPERLSDPEIADPRSDIYSLGGVAFFLLTGRDVFQGKTIAEILAQVMKTTPPRPSDYAASDIPPEIDQLVLDCLAKTPDDRPASITELLEKLEGIAALTTWQAADAERWWREEAS